VTDGAGTVTGEIDISDVRQVRRNGRTVTIKRRGGKDVVLEAASLDDAGRLEGALRIPRPGAPPVAGKRGGFGRALLLGCGGLLALLVLGIVIATMAGNSGRNGGGTSAGEARRANEATLAAGESATAEGLKVTILEIRDPFESANRFSRPSAGNRFVAFKVQIENVGGGSKSHNAFNFKLLDAENFQHKPESIVFAEQALLGQATQLGGGARIEGWIGFEVKQGVGLKELTYDPNPFTTTDIVFRAP